MYFFIAEKHILDHVVRRLLRRRPGTSTVAAVTTSATVADFDRAAREMPDLAWTDLVSQLPDVDLSAGEDLDQAWRDTGFSSALFDLSIPEVREGRTRRQASM